MKLFDRYLLEEIIAPFVVGVMIILVMLLGDALFRLIDLLVVREVEVWTVFRLLLFILPDMMVIAFPLATILAVSLAINRLVREHEWASFRLGGLALSRALLPIHLFGLGVGGLSWLVSEQIAPLAKQQYLTITTRLSFIDPTIVIEPQTWFQPPGGDQWFFVQAVDEASGVMHDLVVFSDLRSDFPSVLTARSARREGNRFVLRDVVRHIWRPDGTLQRESETEVVEILFENFIPQVIGGANSFGDMSTAQLRKMIADLEAQGIRRPDQIVDLHRKYTAPIACYLLALLCVPLNILSGKRGNFVGLLISALLVIVYFLTLQFGISAARYGFLQTVPVLGVWLQNIAFGGLTLALLRRCR